MPGSNLRQICWRARRLTDKKMIYGQLVVFNNQGILYENFDTAWPVDVSTRGQSIGLSDKNGKEIYEGDLLIIKEKEGSYNTYVVVYRDAGFVAKKFDGQDIIPIVPYAVEVVGEYYSSELEQELGEIRKKIETMM